MCSKEDSQGYSNGEKEGRNTAFARLQDGLKSDMLMFKTSANRLLVISSSRPTGGSELGPFLNPFLLANVDWFGSLRGSGAHVPVVVKFDYDIGGLNE